MRYVEKRNYKPENPMVKKFRLAVRDFINKRTGQHALIVQYYDAFLAIARASDESKSPEFKKRAHNALHTVEGGEWVTDERAIWKEGTFNPYRPFQENVLCQKIAQLNAAMKELGIQR